jgi:hypothetical protein
MGTARSHSSLEIEIRLAGVPIAPGRNLIVTVCIQTVPGRILVLKSTIAAAGRSGVEEVYGVPYLDVGCDVCFHVAGFTTSPH